MSFPAIFYSISKRDNSTKHPTGTGTSKTICLKDECGIVNPSIILTGESNPTSFNMVYIASFSRYYHINNWTYDRGEWIADCSVDVLATYKTEISGATKYVLRAANSTGWNGDVVDTYYPTLSGEVYDENMYLTGFWGAPSIVVGIVNNVSDTQTRGCVTYYVLDSSAWETLMTFLMGEPQFTGTTTYSDYVIQKILDSMSVTWTDVGQALIEILRAIMDPIQYIVSAKMFPFTPGSGTPVTVVGIGKWPVPIASGVKRVSQYSVCHNTGWSQTVAIPKHPQSATRGAYLNGSPYSSYILDFAPFGRMAIDGNALKDADYICCDLSVDLVSGDGKLEITATSDAAGQNLVNYIDTVYTQLGCEINLSQITSNFISPAVHVTAGTAAGVMTSGPVLAGLGAAAGIGDAVTSAMPRVSSQGVNGTILPIYTNAQWLEAHFYKIPDANDADAGRPVMADVVLSTLNNGYIKLADGDLAISGTQGEREELARFLTSGFYLE